MTRVEGSSRRLDGRRDDDPRRPRGAGEVVRLAVGADVARLVANDPIAREGLDPEGVHQARVAARRLRSNLATFAPILRDQHAAALSRDLRWLGRHLGEARDADVLGGRLTKAVRAFDPRARDEAFEVLDRLAADRADAHAALQRVLRSGRYRRLLRSLGGFVADPHFRRSARLPAAPFLSDVVYDRFVQLEHAVRTLPALPGDARLHEVRITAKPLRYAAEVGTPVLGERCGRLARRTEDLCDELGSLNDGARAIEWLERVGGEGRSVAVVRLRAGEVARMAEARSSWRRRWSRVRDAAAGLSWPVDGVAG